MAENPPGFVRWPVYHRVRIQFRRDDSRHSITGVKPRVWNGFTPSNPSGIGEEAPGVVYPAILSAALQEAADHGPEARDALTHVGFRGPAEAEAHFVVGLAAGGVVGVTELARHV